MESQEWVKQFGVDSMGFYEDIHSKCDVQAQGEEAQSDSYVQKFVEWRMYDVVIQGGG